MKITNRIKSAIKGFTTVDNNYNEQAALARSFLKYGNQKPLVQDWSSVIMDDSQLYQGYPYAAINVRANKLAQLATENVKTELLDSYETKNNLNDDEFVHPYLKVINESPTFSNYKFWYDISTYIDLEGVYYLMAIRTVSGEGEQKRIGNIQSFKLTNPYNIRRVINEDTGDIGGYVEAKNGFVREIPIDMIIPIVKLNPFNDNEPYAMTDAAKEYQYVLKQAGDYTRHSLKNNMSAPGILNTDVLLPQEQFENFKNRVTSQEKGVPLFGNGAGAITWESMQIDLDKASLTSINEMNRATLFAVSGVGKTIMGIEESGTTRETSKTQKDLFTENHIIPQLQLILDAFNQDYKNNYNKEYSANGAVLYIDSPLGIDKDVELKDKEIELKEIAIKKEEFTLYDMLLSKSYTSDSIKQYLDGDIEINELKIDEKHKKEQEAKALEIQGVPVVEEDKVEEKPIEEKPIEEKPKEENNTIVKYNINNITNNAKPNDNEEEETIDLETIKELNNYLILQNQVTKKSINDVDKTKFIEIATDYEKVKSYIKLDKKITNMYELEEQTPIYSYYLDSSLYKLYCKNALESASGADNNLEGLNKIVNKKLNKKVITFDDYKILTNDYDSMVEAVYPKELNSDLQAIVKTSGYAKQIEYDTNMVIDKNTTIMIKGANLVENDNKYYLEINAVIQEKE